MKRITALVALCAVVSLPATGCNKKDKGTNNPDDAADSDKDPLEELKSIPDQIQAEVDNVLQPIRDVDVVVDQVTSLPQKYNIDASTLQGMVKASMDGGKVEISADLGLADDAKAEVQALLDTVQGIATGLKETPQRVTTATKNIVALGAKATALVAKLQAQYTAKLKNPLAKAEAKAEIQGNLDAVLKLDTDIKAIVADAKSTVTGLPSKGQEALSKLTAAFAS